MEINYQIFDETSGLPIYSLTDKFIRDMAYRQDKPLSEVFNNVRKQVLLGKIQYFVSYDKKVLRAIAGEGLFKCQGTYFLNYQDALNEYNS
jgi:hypothetical protein